MFTVEVALMLPYDAKLLEALEDRLDVEAAREALSESGERVPWEAIKKRFSL